MKSQKSDEVSQQVIIPPGVINPRNTTIVQIPSEYHNTPAVIAKRSQTKKQVDITYEERFNRHRKTRNNSDNKDENDDNGNRDQDHGKSSRHKRHTEHHRQPAVVEVNPPPRHGQNSNPPVINYDEEYNPDSYYDSSHESNETVQKQDRRFDDTEELFRNRHRPHDEPELSQTYRLIEPPQSHGYSSDPDDFFRQNHHRHPDIRRDEFPVSRNDYEFSDADEFFGHDLHDHHEHLQSRDYHLGGSGKPRLRGECHRRCLRNPEERHRHNRRRECRRRGHRDSDEDVRRDGTATPADSEFDSSRYRNYRRVDDEYGDDAGRREHRHERCHRHGQHSRRGESRDGRSGSMHQRDKRRGDRSREICRCQANTFSSHHQKNRDGSRSESPDIIKSLNLNEEKERRIIEKDLLNFQNARRKLLLRLANIGHNTTHITSSASEITEETVIEDNYGRFSATKETEKTEAKAKPKRSENPTSHPENHDTLSTATTSFPSGSHQTQNQPQTSTPQSNQPATNVNSPWTPKAESTRTEEAGVPFNPAILTSIYSAPRRTVSVVRHNSKTYIVESREIQLPSTYCRNIFPPPGTQLYSAVRPNLTADLNLTFPTRRPTLLRNYDRRKPTYSFSPGSQTISEEDVIELCTPTDKFYSSRGTSSRRSPCQMTVVADSSSGVDINGQRATRTLSQIIRFYGKKMRRKPSGGTRKCQCCVIDKPSPERRLHSGSDSSATSASAERNPKSRRELTSLERNSKTVVLSFDGRITSKSDSSSSKTEIVGGSTELGINKKLDSVRVPVKIRSKEKVVVKKNYMVPENVQYEVYHGPNLRYIPNWARNKRKPNKNGHFPRKQITKINTSESEINLSSKVSTENNDRQSEISVRLNQQGNPKRSHYTKSIKPSRSRIKNPTKLSTILLPRKSRHTKSVAKDNQQYARHRKKTNSDGIPIDPNLDPWGYSEKLYQLVVGSDGSE